MKNPSDFVGGALGQSEQQTKGILAATVGKVLVIDEAYGLYGGGNSPGSISDPYKTVVIDTIVAEVQSIPGDDRCVLLLGYKDQLERMFQNVNPGLSRRFPLSSAFTFEDHDENQLRQILNLKLGQRGYEATGQAKDVAMEMLSRARNRPNFGNAGEIDIILDAAVGKHQTRYTRGAAKYTSRLDPVDFDEDFDRANRADTDVKKLFEGTVGLEEVVLRLESYQQLVRSLKDLDMDPKENIPFNYLFRGPPGTGKTTTARKMGKVYYDMGFLATAEVVECSASDLIGQYVGQTGPKVVQLLDKALGKVLFIDEAYRLADGPYAKEAMDEIVDSVTKDRYHKKLIIVLAGYEKDINRLMSMNPGLTSRFPETINFRSLNSEECISLLTQRLVAGKSQLQRKQVRFDLRALETPSESFKQALSELFFSLSKQDNWASARDVQTLAKTLFVKLLGRGDELARKQLIMDETAIITELKDLLQERKARGDCGNTISMEQLFSQPMTSRQDICDSRQPADRTTTTASKASERATKESEENKEEHTEPVAEQRVRSSYPGIRDAGVKDAVWEQLQRDWQAEQEKENEYQSLLKEKETASETV